MPYITTGGLGRFRFAHRIHEGEHVIHVNVGYAGAVLVTPEEASDLIAGLTDVLREIAYLGDEETETKAETEAWR